MKLYYAKSPLISSDIYPMQYGEQQCENGYSFGPAVRNFYVIHYIYSGQGELHIHNKTYNVHAGQFFLIYPRQTAYYKADDNEPWLYRWIEFDGSFSEKLMAVTGFSHENHVINDDNGVGNALKQIIDLGWSDFETIMSHFWSLITALTKGKLLKKDENTAETYVSNAKNYIRSNVHKRISVSEIAHFLNIDRSHLARIFKSICGISTQQFIISLKMEMASQTLKKSSMTIKEVANSVGYVNQMEFSKLFKKHFHMAPTRWREQEFFQQSINNYE
ncbi:AraC family transcriptional regulator [Paenibacillus methanolicus]|uniref:AraC-like DNA-binding protein n=1 Tax=Paenibacillus methanolicus TaxID=582686 RepID=A0A5S5CG13_9BACL|nr:AraC family transcriptional regulator [Paenibacillus methanolicus]TYP77462.1 AraC-like DNA-binding protein [Paenibacillus methanolicus]